MELFLWDSYIVHIHVPLIAALFPRAASCRRAYFRRRIVVDVLGGISANEAQRRWSARRREICTYVHSKNQSLASKPLQEQIRKWKLRRNHLQKMANRPSTAQAVLPAVASNRDDLENQEKAAIDVDN